jgi:TonB dependent receptor
MWAWRSTRSGRRCGARVEPHLLTASRSGNVELAVTGPSALYAVPNPIVPFSLIPQPPAITISGGATPIGYVSNAFVNATNPRSVAYTMGNVADDVNYLHGKHAFQFGFQYKTWDDNTWIGNSGVRGTYTFNSLEQFLQGGPALTFAVLVQPNSDAARGWRQHLIAFYGEDTYKVKTNLTLTLGMRFEWCPDPLRPTECIPPFLIRRRLQCGSVVLPSKTEHLS